MEQVCRTKLEISLFTALRQIASYQEPEELRYGSWRQWGLDSPEEAISMAYENVLSEAKSAIGNVRLARPDEAADS